MNKEIPPHRDDELLRLIHSKPEVDEAQMTTLQQRGYSFDVACVIAQIGERTLARQIYTHIEEGAFSKKQLREQFGMTPQDLALLQEALLRPERGGHNKNQPSDKAKGFGPVYEIRMAQINPETGKPGMTQQQFADAVHCSKSTIEKCEATGTLPSSRAVQANILELAPVSSTPTTKAEPEKGGVLL